MADTKTSGLTALASGASASGDLLMLVDVSDTTMAGTGTNKKMTLDNFFGNLPVGIGFGDEEISEYDEGTWTPTLGASTADGSHTYGAQGGGYIRIGDLCFAWWDCNVTTLDAAISGNVYIRGLPFTAKGGSNPASAGAIGLISKISWTDHATLRVPGGVTYVDIRNAKDGLSAVSITDAELGSSPRINGMVVYQTT